MGGGADGGLGQMWPPSPARQCHYRGSALFSAVLKGGRGQAYRSPWKLPPGVEGRSRWKRRRGEPPEAGIFQAPEVNMLGFEKHGPARCHVSVPLDRGGGRPVLIARVLDSSWEGRHPASGRHVAADSRLPEPPFLIELWMVGGKTVRRAVNTQRKKMDGCDWRGSHFEEASQAEQDKCPGAWPGGGGLQKAIGM